MKKNVIIGLSLIFIWGCSLFQPPSQVLKINSTQPGIVAIVNGEAYMTPNMVLVKRHKDVSIYCRKEGFHPFKKTVGHHFNSTGVLDFAGTFIFIFPALGLFSKGIWSINTTEVNIEMHPIQYGHSQRQDGYSTQ